MKFAIMNGEMIPRSEAKIDIEDRGYQFGDGVYEVIRVYNGVLFTGKEHLKRLLESCKKIEIHLEYTIEELISLLERLVAKNQLSLGTIYLQITRGISPRSHAFPLESPRPTFIAYTNEFDRPLEQMKSGTNAIVCEDIRWLRCDIKSLNLLGNILAKQKAKEAKCYEAIQYREKIVTEGSSSNIWMVKDGVVKTHPANHFILNGITRQKIIQVCQINNISIKEVSFTLDELKEADEVFMSSTTSEVMPLVEIGGVKVRDGKCGPITFQLQQLFEKEIIKECGALYARLL
ncbi:D-amino-acid transaminase [Bacillus sp. 03113]|uniref:D-amino-acid transaminase n=1 Tax=Bacillus sp. 03113 TaxID=2578211 RepID=UPI0011444CFB|nr:D-amino-acid transaminase [Bacillus sp. 03113]